MLYTEFMNRVCDSCIFTNEITGKSFIAPCYRLYMKEDGLDPKDVSDMEVTYNDVKEYMELEIKRRDNILDNTSELLSWINDLVFNKTNALLNEETNEIAKDLIEYMKLKKELEVKTEEEKLNLKSKNKINGYNYSKKEI